MKPKKPNIYKNLIKNKKNLAIILLFIFTLSILLVFYSLLLNSVSENFKLNFSFQNSKEIANHDTFTLIRKVNGVTTQKHFTCIKGEILGHTFYKNKRGSCKNNFFNREVIINNNDLILRFYLELPFKVKVIFYSLILSILLIFTIFLKLINDIVLEKHRSKIELGNMASQVAHDIRSPLTALEMATKEIIQLPEDTRVMMREGLSRIKDICNNLLDVNRNIKNKSKKLTDYKTPKNEVSLLSPLIESIVSEKRTQNRNKKNVSINYHIKRSSYGIFSLVNTTELKRILSNLINNSVESFATSSGIIDITLSSTLEWVLIKISDNGKGIPHDILAQLGEKGKTFGKSKGNGLGIFYAKTTLEGWGGNFEIESTLNQGTGIFISLKKHPSPNWFIDKLMINSDIVILDDDESIHQVWDGRFNAEKIKDKGYKLIHFSSVDGAKKWFINNKNRKYIFLCDFELIGQSTNGLDFIKNHCKSSNSILVTSRYDEFKIKEKCQELGVKLIPKSMASIVPIEIIESVNPNTQDNLKRGYVYIEDDKYLRMAWERSATEKNIELSVFECPSHFEKHLLEFDKSVTIYIDSSFDNEDIRGEIFAQKIYEQGFSNIYLATGYEPEHFQNMPWLKGITEKSPPWAKLY